MRNPRKTGPAWEEWKRNRSCAPQSLEAEAYEAGRRDAAAIVRASKEHMVDTAPPLKCSPEAGDAWVSEWLEALAEKLEP